MPTNMTIFKPPKYLCFLICNVDDAKVINWICIWSKQIFLRGSNKHRTKTGNQKHTAQRREIKINKVVLDDEITKPTKEKLKICEISLNWLKEKENNLEEWFRVKIDPKSPLFDKARRREVVTARVWEKEKRGRVKGDKVVACSCLTCCFATDHFGNISQQRVAQSITWFFWQLVSSFISILPKSPKYYSPEPPVSSCGARSWLASTIPTNKWRA